VLWIISPCNMYEFIGYKICSADTSIVLLCLSYEVPCRVVDVLYVLLFLKFLCTCVSVSCVASVLKVFASFLFFRL